MRGAWLAFVQEHRGVLIARVAGGNVLAQVITLASAPVLSRLFTPAHFGAFATVVALAAVLTTLAPLALDQALHIPQDEREAAGLALAALTSTLVFALATGLILAVIPWDSSFSVAIFAPFLLAAGGMANVFAAWITRRGDFRRIIVGRLAGAIAGSVVMLCAGWFWPLSGALGLLTGQLVGALASLFVLARGFHPPPHTPRAAAALRALVGRHRNFPLWRLPADVLNTLANQVPVWLFSGAFGPAVAGHYSLVNRVFNLPVSLVGNAAGDVFRRDAGEAYREARACLTVFDRYAGFLSLLGLIVCVPVALFGPGLFATVFGAEWRPAGELARWMSVWLFLRFTVSPLLFVLVIVARPKVDLAMQATLLLVAGASWACAARGGSFAMTLGLFIGGYSLVYIAGFFVCRSLAAGPPTTPSPP